MNIKKNLINKLKKISKTKYISILVLIILAATITLPTLARYKNRLTLENILETTEAWDGTIATSYHSGNGTETNPYIISNAKELALLSTELQNDKKYENTYFKLSNNIIINNGTFIYQDDKIIYNTNSTNFYVKEYTNEIYDNEEYTTKISTINIFSSLKNFKGYLDGDYNRIYGLYMASDTSTQLGLFENLMGTVKNLYLENTMIYGGSSSAVLASTAQNANIENVYVKGNVVSKKIETPSLRIYNMEDQSREKKNDSIDLPTTLNKEILSIRLKGIYTPSTATDELTIDNTTIKAGEFTIDLGTSPSNTITLKQAQKSAYTLTNLIYEVDYATGYASGVIANASSTNLNNIINKANVYGIDEATGIVGQATNINLTNAYNTGNIIGTNKASGLISTVKNSTSSLITKTYNAGVLQSAETSSFISEVVNNQNITLTNSFNIVPAQTSIASSDAIVMSNVQDVNQPNQLGITMMQQDQITNHNNLKQTLNYEEYIDKIALENNKNAIWVYEENTLPTLYIDDINDSIAVLNVGTYTWEGLGYELTDTYLTSATAFKITPKDQNEEITSYYYIHKEKNALTKEQLEQITDWTEYNEIVSIKEEGYYVIYAKVIDSEGNIKYINSEQLIVDLEAPQATITMNDKIWTKYSDDLSNNNISETTQITLFAEDKYSTVEEVKYYISNIFLTKEELNLLGEEKWITYQTPITISEKGTYIVNVKTKDSSNHTAYYNTDYIVFGGFEENLSLGRKETVYERLDITNKSSVTYNFTYNDKTQYQEGYKTVLKVDNTLPVNTKITLINNNTKQVFTYYVETSSQKYNLNNFTEIGQIDKTKTFNDQNFINESTKDISLIFDFSKTTQELSIKPYIEIQDNSNKVILSTLKSTLKETSVYTNADSTLIINNLQELDTIHYNSDSTTTIDLETYLLNKTLDESTINDSLDDQRIGLAIKLVDKDNNIVEKKYLKNILIKINDNYYSPDNDGIVRANISNEVVKTTTNVTITTYATGIKLPTGNYQFIITPFISSDGLYTKNYSASSVKVPVTTTKKEEVNYGFNVILSEDDKVLYKNQDTAIMNFTIKELSTFANPNIRMSLHKKVSLSAYDQTYEMINLKDYTINELTSVEDNIYYVTMYDLQLSLNTTKLQKTGYEIKFDLYDGTTYITSIKKKFIVR